MRPPAGTQMYPTSYFGAAAPFWLKPPRRISGRGTGQLESTARHPNGGHGMGQSALSRTAEATTVSTLAGSDASGYADGQGAAASFYRPTGVAVDGAGNVFVADCYNHRIRKISAGGAVSTLAGSGASGYADGQGAAASFYRPTGVAVDGAGNVFVADCYNHRIRKISAGGAVSTLAGSGASGHADGQGAAASFWFPRGVAVDGAGNVFVADCYNHRIRKISAGGAVSTLAGSGASGREHIGGQRR
ncbi:unnamed protein product [Prorocentrum cordatum]|uniref:Peptidylamidoglycolate lyase n=1 Tax=Prorocentrum cordatum TaxID=2364126 RepID=A0ABN9SG58_9DINO|nr:unnamed protein product [Polarella glacialis]